MRVSEICVNQIRVNQGLGVDYLWQCILPELQYCPNVYEIQLQRLWSLHHCGNSEQLKEQ